MRKTPGMIALILRANVAGVTGADVVRSQMTMIARASSFSLRFFFCVFVFLFKIPCNELHRFLYMDA